MCWNLGVAVGVGGILAGGSTGFENLEMPPYAARLVFLGYLMIVVWGALTFHQRRERQLYVSQWFLFAALFWFPWIYSTADLLLFTFRVRGMAQAVIAWWYSDNLLVVWLGLVGLAAVFYFVPKLTGRELHSRYLALLTFWMLILFGSWGGIPASAPVPAWMPVSSAVATGLGVIGIMAVALNVHGTLGGQCSKLMAHPSLRFIGFGVVAFIVAGLMSAAGALSEVSHVTQFTWFTVARGLLNSYGFFAMVMFGAVYYIVPQLMGLEFPSARLVRAHFWIAAAGSPAVRRAAGGRRHRAGTQAATREHPFHRHCPGHPALSAGEHDGRPADGAGPPHVPGEPGRPGDPILPRPRRLGLGGGHGGDQACGGQAMNYGPLVFLAAFFALASSWCGFVLTPQLQIGRLQQTNTVGGAAAPYPVAPARAGAAGDGSLSRQRLRLLPQPAGGPDRDGAGDRADRGGNEPGGHHRRVAQAGRELARTSPPALTLLPPLQPGLSNAASATMLEGLPKAFLRSSTREAANAAVKTLNATSAKAQLWIVPVGPDLARGWGKRRSVAEDYLFDRTVMPGSQRVGPGPGERRRAPAGRQLASASSVCPAARGEGLDHAAVSVPVREAQDRAPPVARSLGAPRRPGARRRLRDRAQAGGQSACGLPDRLRADAPLFDAPMTLPATAGTPASTNAPAAPAAASTNAAPTNAPAK